MASVEFAMVVAPFLLIIFGFIAVNAVMNARSSMLNAAQMAARMMSTGQIKNFSSGTITGAYASATTTCTSGMSNTIVEYYACNGLPPVATYTVTAIQDCSVPSVTVRVAANAFTAGIGDVYDLFFGKTITAQAVLMKEGTCP